MTSYKINQDTRKRLEIMAETNDGFRIAEADIDVYKRQIYSYDDDNKVIIPNKEE